MSYVRALEITKMVIDTITGEEFVSINKILSCEELRNIVYDTITHYQVLSDETEFEVSSWASKYARKYNRNKEIVVIKQIVEQKLNYSYIRNNLLKEVLDSVTNNREF